MVVAQIQIGNILKHRLTIVHMLYGIWWVKNSDFWVFLPVILQKKYKKIYKK